MITALDITLSSVLTDIASVATAMFTGVGQVFTTIMGQPILLIGISIPVVGAMVGFANRLFRVG